MGRAFQVLREAAKGLRLEQGGGEVGGVRLAGGGVWRQEVLQVPGGRGLRVSVSWFGAVEDSHGQARAARGQEPTRAVALGSLEPLPRFGVRALDVAHGRWHLRARGARAVHGVSHRRTALGLQ